MAKPNLTVLNNKIAQLTMFVAQFRADLYLETFASKTDFLHIQLIKKFKILK